MNKTKVCKHCKRELPLNTDYYFKNVSRKDGFLSKCKECMGRKFTDKLTKIPKDGHKFCIKCDRELKSSIRFFPPDSGCKDGLRNVCRECGKDGHFMGEGYVPKKWWEKEDEELLAKIYPHYTNQEIIDKFFPDSTLKALSDKAYSLCLENKTDETMKRVHEEVSVKLSGENSYNYGKTLPAETRKKISLSKKGKYKGENSYWYGRKRSKEQCIEMSRRRIKEGAWRGNKNPRHIKPLFGEENGRWQGGVKRLYFDLRDKIGDWKYESMKSCNYNCVLTGKNFDEIHHLYSFNSIVKELFENIHLEQHDTIGDYSEDERLFIIDNLLKLHKKYGLGVCLIKEIHKLFHDMYGYGENTPSQFHEFKTRLRMGEFNDFLEENNLKLII